ncbi:MAG: histone deacetylase [Planctomycetaceae bacterium]|nr:histone deacetylase [Planctomycetaceae bacterium]
MRVVYTDHFAVPLPPGHRFPMHKYAELRRKLVADGVLREDELFPARPAPVEALLAVHDEGYVRGYLDGSLDAKALARIGFPWSPAMVARTLASAGGTLLAVEFALADGFAGVLAGGTHHAGRAFGAGFCVFNDLAVAAASLLGRGAARRVLVVDLDVHQGDGTAEIFAADERVFTFSVHGERNFPLRKQLSDLDVPLRDGTADDEYLASLDTHLAQALERSRPDFVLYQGGVDPLEHDRLGRLKLTQAGLAERDRLVFTRLRERGLPLVATLGGGYSDPIEPTLEAHVNTYRVARDVFGAARADHF